MNLTLAGYCAVVVAASLLGGVLPLASVLTHTRLQVYLSFAAGVMLGAAFFHMMPEAVESGSAATLRWTAGGLLALFFLERFFTYHHHEAPESDVPQASRLPPHHAPQRRPDMQWGAAAFGLAVHSLVGGVALASAVASDVAGHGRPGPASWGVFLATIVHKPADALTIVTLMLRAGASRGWAHLVNLGFSLMIPLGVLLLGLGMRWFDPEGTATLAADALAFSAGTFLCIALSDLLPELHFHAHDRVKLSLALLAGFGLMAASGAWEVLTGQENGHVHLPTAPPR
jgi:zinc and cadmium transporter